MRRTDLPHVTDILRDAGLIDATWFTDWSRDRGTAVHEATRYDDEGDLDESSIDPAVAPRLAAYRAFRRDAQPVIHAIELPVEHDLHGYCGTVDRVVEIAGRRGVLDIKPPSREPWHALQLAAYAACFDTAMRRWSLHLHDDETYRLVEHTDRNDARVFSAALTLVKWRRDNCPTKS